MYQVSCSLSDPETKEREIAGALDAMQTYKLKEALILTLDERDEYAFEREGKHYRIMVKPVW